MAVAPEFNETVRNRIYCRVLGEFHFRGCRGFVQVGELEGELIGLVLEVPRVRRVDRREEKGQKRGQRNQPRQRRGVSPSLQPPAAAPTGQAALEEPLREGEAEEGCCG